MNNSLFTVISSCLRLQNRINTGSICSKLVDILRDRNSRTVIRGKFFKVFVSLLRVLFLVPDVKRSISHSLLLKQFTKLSLKMIFVARLHVIKLYTHNSQNSLHNIQFVVFFFLHIK